MSNQASSGADDSGPGCKLFVGGLSHETTDASLLQYFESFGTVVSAVVLRDPETLSSRGFGFVTFSSRKEAQNCLNFGNHTIDDKNVETKFALPRTQNSNTTSTSLATNPPANQGSTTHANDYLESNNNSNDNEVHSEEDYIETKVFVGGLLYATVADSLREYFKKFGTVDHTEIIYNKETKISRGFGFVQFKEPSAVKAVIAFQSDSQRHRVDGKKVEVKRCLKRSEPNTGSSSANTNIPSNSSNSHPLTTSSSDDSNAAPPPSPVVKIGIPKKPANSSSVKVTSFAQAAALGTKHEKKEKEKNVSKSPNQTTEKVGLGAPVHVQMHAHEVPAPPPNTPVLKEPQPPTPTSSNILSDEGLYDFLDVQAVDKSIDFDLDLKDDEILELEGPVRSDISVEVPLFEKFSHSQQTHSNVLNLNMGLDLNLENVVPSPIAKPSAIGVDPLDELSSLGYDSFGLNISAENQRPITPLKSRNNFSSSVNVKPSPINSLRSISIGISPSEFSMGFDALSDLNISAPPFEVASSAPEAKTFVNLKSPANGHMKILAPTTSVNSNNGHNSQSQRSNQNLHQQPMHGYMQNANGNSMGYFMNMQQPRQVQMQMPPGMYYQNSTSMPINLLGQQQFGLGQQNSMYGNQLQQVPLPPGLIRFPPNGTSGTPTADAQGRGYQPGHSQGNGYSDMNAYTFFQS